MRLEVDREACVGAGHVHLTAPAVFTQSNGWPGRAPPVIPGPGQEAAAREAADLCPSGAITVHGHRPAPR